MSKKEKEEQRRWDRILDVPRCALCDHDKVVRQVNKGERLKNWESDGYDDVVRSNVIAKKDFLLCEKCNDFVKTVGFSSAFWLLFYGKTKGPDGKDIELKESGKPIKVRGMRPELLYELVEPE